MSSASRRPKPDWRMRGTFGTTWSSFRRSVASSPDVEWMLFRRLDLLHLREEPVEDLDGLADTCGQGENCFLKPPNWEVQGQAMTPEVRSLGKYLRNVGHQ